MANIKTKGTPLLFSIPEACAKLGIKQNSLFNLIKAGQIRPVKIGARTLFPADEIFRFVEGLKEDRRVKQLV
ncbi:MAG: helix-turn-helix domain-containing protein [Methylocella sp.]